MMHKMIDFPNLGIHLENVGKTVTVFGFEIAFYGMLIGLGILCGIFMATREAKRTRQDPDLYYDLAIAGVVVAIIGARLYYVAFSWDMYKDDLLSIFNLRQGGLAIYGGVIGAVLCIFVFSKIRGLNARLLLDTVAFGLPTGQMIGRWGNFCNREAFGEYTDGLFAMRLPLDAVRSSDVTQKMMDHLQNIDGVSYIQVTPTFLYESFWCLVVIVLLLLYRKHKKFDGELFLLYLLGYGLGRSWIEGLRTDQLLLPGIGLPTSQCLAVILVIFSAVTILLARKSAKRIKK